MDKGCDMSTDILIELSEVVNDGLNYMKRVSKNLSVLTDAISSGNENEVVKNYNNLKEGLHWVDDVIERTDFFLKVDYLNMTISRQSAAKIISQFKEYIEDLETAFVQKKYDRLGQLIENELPKHLKKIISIFNKLNTIITEKHN